MSLISINNLSFEYEGSYKKVFNNVSFKIDTNWKLGFTGRNGKGKTTFLKLLMGEYDYTGEINVSGTTFSYYPYEIKDKTKTAISIINDISAEAEMWQIKREASLLDIDENTLFRSFNKLSGGEQTKIMLIGLFLHENNYLLIDEPTNHLDTVGRRKVSAYLNSKKSFILVSHDRIFLDNSVDHILSINKTNIEIQKGNFSSWWENKKKIDDFEIAMNEKLKKDIKRLDESAKRTSQWSEKVEKTKYNSKNSGIKPDRGYVGHKSAKMMKRSKSIESRKLDAAREKTNLLKNIESAEKLSINPLIYHSEKLVDIRGVSIHFANRSVCNDVFLTVNQGDRVLITGKNGTGKTSLLKLIAGENIPFRGNMFIAKNTIVSIVQQDTSNLFGNLKEYAENNNISETLFKAILNKLDFSRENFNGDISAFSSGQKKKVLIARSLCERAHIYIWDEPLNYIDVLSRIQIEELILECKPTMLFVEHDEQFAEKIATKTIQL